MSQFPLLPLTTSINFLPFLLLFPSDIFLSSLLSFHQRYIIMLNKFRCCISLFKLFMLDYFRSEEHTSELQSRFDLVYLLILVNKKFYMLDTLTICIYSI